MYKPMQTYNRSFIKSSCSYLAILSCFVCLPLPVYAYYTSGSCKACSTGCSSGYTSTKPSSSQCYTNSNSYFSCSSASNVACYKCGGGSSSGGDSGGGSGTTRPSDCNASCPAGRNCTTYTDSGYTCYKIGPCKYDYYSGDPNGTGACYACPTCCNIPTGGVCNRYRSGTNTYIKEQCSECCIACGCPPGKTQVGSSCQ